LDKINELPKSLNDEFELFKFIKSIKTLFIELDKIDPKGHHFSRVKEELARINKL
tara:strand:- start:1172 stop:1336 length:165 start_codon:yes stop_codon:yes gene_type:complete